MLSESLLKALFQEENVHANGAAAAMNVNLEIAKMKDGVKMRTILLVAAVHATTRALAVKLRVMVTLNVSLKLKYVLGMGRKCNSF